MDFPEPVEPAIKRCGIFEIGEYTYPPVIFLPIGTYVISLFLLNFSLLMSSFIDTISLFSFGTSIPTTPFPGIGAITLIFSAFKASARSLDRLDIFDNFIPGSGLYSNLVITGPFKTFTMVPVISKFPSLLSIIFLYFSIVFSGIHSISTGLFRTFRNLSWNSPLLIAKENAGFSGISFCRNLFILNTSIRDLSSSFSSNLSGVIVSFTILLTFSGPFLLITQENILINGIALNLRTEYR
ncbi:hypothetical protein ES703_28811 [subsurface metagenome]